MSAKVSGVTSPVPVALACKRPQCQNNAKTGAGRPSLFCSTTCQRAYQGDREEVRKHLKDAQRLAAQYELDEYGQSTHSDSRTAPGAPHDPELLRAIRLTLTALDVTADPLAAVHLARELLTNAERSHYLEALRIKTH